MAHPRRMGWSAGRVLWWLAALVPLLLLLLVLVIESRHPNFPARGDTSDVLVIGLALLTATVGAAMAATSVVRGMEAFTLPLTSVTPRGRTAQLVERSRMRTKAATLIALGGALIAGGLLLALARTLAQL